MSGALLNIGFHISEKELIRGKKCGCFYLGACEVAKSLQAGVSIIFKIRVFHKARFEGFEFFIRWPYAVFHKMQVVFYRSAHFMYL